MRRIFIAMFACGFLLLSGVAASAKPDSGNGQQGQKGQQQTQTQNDQKATQLPAKPATTPGAKPATPAGPSTCSAQAEQTGEFQGEHQDADCNGPQDQSGANESKTEATDQAAANGNNED